MLATMAMVALSLVSSACGSSDEDASSAAPGAGQGVQRAVAKLHDAVLDGDPAGICASLTPRGQMQTKSDLDV